MEKQSGSQAPAQAGSPSQAPVSAPENQNQNQPQAQAQTQNQPQTAEELENVQAWNRAYRELDDVLTGVVENLYIAEDRMRHAEQVATRRTTDVNNYGDLFSRIHLRYADLYKIKEANPVPSAEAVKGLEDYLRLARESIRELCPQEETTQQLLEKEATWFEEHEQKIGRFQGYRQNTPGKQVIQNFLEGRSSLKYHQDQLRWRQEKLAWHREAVKYHEEAIQKIERRERDPAQLAPPPAVDLSKRIYQQERGVYRAPAPQRAPTGVPITGSAPHNYYDAEGSGLQRFTRSSARWGRDQPPAPATHRPIPGPSQPPVIPNQGQREVRTEPRQRPRRLGGSAPAWTDEEENWLIVHTMYPGASTRQLAANIPGGKSRSNHSITGHMGEMRLRGRLPTSWTINAPEHDDRPWNIEEDMELLRWHANGRTVIDSTVFIEQNRSGTAAYRRARFLLEDQELERRAMGIERLQREALAEADASSDVQMAGDETADEERATEDLRQAILQSLSSRPPMQ